MILPFLIIFLPIFSLSGIEEVSHLSFIIKNIAQIERKNELFMKANEVLNKLENNFLNTRPTCLIPKTTAWNLLRQPLSWWQSHTCGGNLSQIRYYYAVEWLESDPCSIMYKKRDSKRYIANFYRITLVIAQTELIKKRDYKLYLQRTLAVPTDPTSICQEKEHEVMLGKQMQREI